MNRKLLILSFVVIVIAIIIFIITPSSVFHCVRYELPKPPKLEGILAVNDILTKADYLLKHKIIGPESILVDKDGITTGTGKGTVINIKDENIQKIFRFSSIDPDQCDGTFDMEPKCGRPLGLRRLNNETILAIDTYLGIFSINLETG
uniref:Adipocyte plasma membrane-associated protein n=2 Tax=Onchocerca TaxID=6281 RepID=A0A8R1XPB1_ONCVO